MSELLTAESAYAALRDAPSIALDNRAELPKISGLYGAWADGVLLYVGISVNIHSRWRSHHCLDSISTEEYPSACLSWIPIEGAEARVMELGIIREYKPRFNRASNPAWWDEVRKPSTPTGMVFARVSTEIVEALEKYAKMYERAPSYVVRNAIVNFLNDKGALPKEIDVRAYPMPHTKKQFPITA